MRRGGRAVVSAVVLAAALAPAACRSKATPPSGATGAHPRVLLVGVDGLDPLILERLIAAGRLPTFARLRAEGAYGPLRSREPILSPLVWTSIATGRAPQDHGILDFVEVGADGTPAPITSVRRHAPALWNILTEFGKRPGFVGWYASYPAETTGGFQVSDRLAFHQVKSARATAGATYPEGLAADLRGSLGEPAPDEAATRTRFLADPTATLSPDGARRLGDLAKIHATTEFYRKALPVLQDRFHTDTLAVYFELVDACGHLFMEDAPPRRPEVSDADARAFGDTVDRCYQYQDEVLADLLRLAGEGTTTLVVSDHGFKSGDLRPRTPGRADVGLAPLWHRLHGVFLAHGHGVRAGASVQGAGILDVAPTVLALQSVHLSKELPGRPIESAFLPGALTVRSVAAYAPPPRPDVTPALAPDPEAVEKLRALGYLGGTGTARGAVAAGDEGRTAASYLNEGSARSVDGDQEGALAAYTKVLSLDPKNVNARVFAARIHTRRGEMARARELLDQGLALDPRSASVRLQRAYWALRAGDTRMASAELREAERLDDNLPYLHLLKARLAAAEGRPAEALQGLGRAAALTDSEGLLAEIAAARGQIEGDGAMQRGDYRGAAAAYRAALEAAGATPDSVLLRKLGQAQGGASSYSDAEAAFRRALTSAQADDEREGAYGDLSLLFQKMGREPDALATLEEATKRLPKSAPLWGMLGAAYGRAGRLDDAMVAYERSVALAPSALSLKTLAALVFERRNDRPRAVALWKRSLALDPAQPDVRGFLDQYGGR
jgi:tetratricopeptide (TPR) repeat protein/predicted AlkP superfamily phosphohydrolase/phosphomutase